MTTSLPKSIEGRKHWQSKYWTTWAEINIRPIADRPFIAHSDQTFWSWSKWPHSQLNINKWWSLGKPEICSSTQWAALWLHVKWWRTWSTMATLHNDNDLYMQQMTVLFVGTFKYKYKYDQHFSWLIHHLMHFPILSKIR